MCETDQSTLCGFDHINGELEHDINHDCSFKPIMHTTQQDKYCKIVTREFPLLSSSGLLSKKDDQLTLVVKYSYNNVKNDIVSVHLKARDIRTNSTQWHSLSLDDVKKIVDVLTAVRNDIVKDEEVVLF